MFGVHTSRFKLVDDVRESCQTNCGHFTCTTCVCCRTPAWILHRCCSTRICPEVSGGAVPEMGDGPKSSTLARKLPGRAPGVWGPAREFSHRARGFQTCFAKLAHPAWDLSDRAGKFRDPTRLGSLWAHSRSSRSRLERRHLRKYPELTLRATSLRQPLRCGMQTLACDTPSVCDLANKKDTLGEWHVKHINRTAGTFGLHGQRVVCRRS